MICTVVGALPEPELVIPQGSFVIAADEGYALLASRGVVPDLTVGDFDSLGFVPQTTEIVRHPVRKDDTDMLLAVREGLRRGCGGLPPLRGSCGAVALVPRKGGNLPPLPIFLTSTWARPTALRLMCATRTS